MPFSDPPTGSLTLPAGAADTDPRIVLGDDIPDELGAYYAAFGETVRSAILYYVSDTIYLYEASTTNDGGDIHLNSVTRGMVLAGEVREATRYEYRPIIGGYAPSLQVGRRDADASFVQWAGTFLLAVDTEANIEGPLTIGNTVRLSMMCVLTRSTAQGMPNSSAASPVYFDTIERDPYGMAHPHTVPGQYDGVTVPFDGWYAVACSSTFATNITGVRAWTIKRNSGLYTEMKIPAVTTSGAHPGLVHDPAFYANAGDVIGFNNYQNSGGVLNITQAKLSVRMVSLA